ncbi:MAG: hypothetical protein P8Y62_10240 [candidate division WOR-3 bacterium]
MDDIKVDKYRPEIKDNWDNFVEKSNNGTIFHKIQFLDYHPPDRFNFHHLIFHKQSNPIAVLPGLLNNGVFKHP